MSRTGLFGQLSENTNSAYVSGHRYGRTDLQTMRRTLRDLKEGRCEAPAQVFVSRYRVTHGLEFLGDFMGNGRVLLFGGLAPSKEFGVILWAGRSPFFLLLLLFSFLTSGVPPNEVFQSRALGRATGQSEIWLKIGA